MPKRAGNEAIIQAQGLGLSKNSETPDVNLKTNEVGD
jgi:hypothetical protein